MRTKLMQSLFEPKISGTKKTVPGIIIKYTSRCIWIWHHIVSERSMDLSQLTLWRHFRSRMVDSGSFRKLWKTYFENEKQIFKWLRKGSGNEYILGLLLAVSNATTSSIYYICRHKMTQILHIFTSIFYLNDTSKMKTSYKKRKFISVRKSVKKQTNLVSFSRPIRKVKNMLKRKCDKDMIDKSRLSVKFV